MVELSIQESVTLACLLEAIAPKPGNVHRGADFEDLTLNDLAVSAVLIGSVFQGAHTRSVGQLAKLAIQRIQSTVATNTYLGTVMLLAPLAKSACGANPTMESIRANIGHTLRQLTADDARDVYLAIRHAQPGGMGQRATMDIQDEPPVDLLAAMRLAADEDLIARQYTNNFATIFDAIVPCLLQGFTDRLPLSEAIVAAHVRTMAEFPDSLIGRKQGPAVAEQARHRARGVLDAGSPGSIEYHQALGDLDFWLRSDGNLRNPGTTADLIAAGLFVLLRTGQIPFPLRPDPQET